MFSCRVGGRVRVWVRVRVRVTQLTCGDDREFEFGKSRTMHRLGHVGSIVSTIRVGVTGFNSPSGTSGDKRDLTDSWNHF